MENDKNSENEIFPLLQPELLTEKELREILIDRCVSRNLSNSTKKEMVELFRKVALPLPQREYTGTSWREKRLMQKQKRTKRVISFSQNISSSSRSEPAKKAPRLHESTSSRLNDSNNSPQSRLKPPPNLINYDKKKIKLSSSSKSSELDKIVIKRKSTEERKESSEEKSKPKAFVKSTSNGKEVSSCKSEKSSSSIIKLKRDSFSTKDGLKPEENKSEDLSKKKRQKIVISWT